MKSHLRGRYGEKGGEWPSDGFKEEFTEVNRSKETAQGTARGTVRSLQTQSGELFDGYTGFPQS